MRRQIPFIAITEAVAQRWVERRGDILIRVPMIGDFAGFASEMTCRAGLLDNVSLPYGSDWPGAAVAYVPRSWETGISYFKEPMTKHRACGMPHVVLASRAGHQPTYQSVSWLTTAPLPLAASAQWR